MTMIGCREDKLEYSCVDPVPGESPMHFHQNLALGMSFDQVWLSSIIDTAALILKETDWRGRVTALVINGRYAGEKVLYALSFKEDKLYETAVHSTYFRSDTAAYSNLLKAVLSYNTERYGSPLKTPTKYLYKENYSRYEYSWAVCEGVTIRLLASSTIVDDTLHRNLSIMIPPIEN